MRRGAVNGADEDGSRDEGVEGHDGNGEKFGLLNGTEGCGPRKAEFTVVRMGSTSVYYTFVEARRQAALATLVISPWR